MRERPSDTADLRHPNYALVLLVEAVVIATLWWLGRYFG